MHLSKRHTYPLQLCCPLNYGQKQALNYINKSSMETTVDEMKKVCCWQSQELNYGDNCCLQGSKHKLVRGPHWWWGSKCMIPIFCSWSASGAYCFKVFGSKPSCQGKRDSSSFSFKYVPISWSRLQTDNLYVCVWKEGVRLVKSIHRFIDSYMIWQLLESEVK
jgi:hypothetical protein